MKTFILSLILITTSAAFAQDNHNTAYVSVNGEGTVTVVPDVVTINLGVSTEAKDAQTAKSENDKAIDAVIKYTKKMGIPENNVKTQYVSLNKRTKYEEKEDYYFAQQTMTIKLEKLDMYEELMQGLVSQGANTINGVDFSSSNIKEYENKARAAAVNNAKDKAQQYAQVLGQSIGKAVAITENGVSNFVPLQRAMMKTSSADASAETLSPGEMEITQEVSISFELK